MRKQEEAAAEAAAAAETSLASTSSAATDLSDALFLALDDSSILRGYLLTVFRRLGAHPASRALGAGSDERCSIAELSEFVELALGEGAAGGRMADVVVLDNNVPLEDSRDKTKWERDIVYGGELARELRRRGFGGVIVIFSGISQSEERELLEEGNVDLVISKDGVATLEHRLREAYRLGRKEPASAGEACRGYLPSLAEAPCSRGSSASSGLVAAGVEKKWLVDDAQLAAGAAGSTDLRALRNYDDESVVSSLESEVATEEADTSPLAESGDANKREMTESKRWIERQEDEEARARSLDLSNGLRRRAGPSVPPQRPAPPTPAPPGWPED